MKSNGSLPALYHLHRGKRLPDDLALMAVSRRDWSRTQWLTFMHGRLPEQLGDNDYQHDVFEAFALRFRYLRVEHNNRANFAHLKSALARPRGVASRDIIFYFTCARASAWPKTAH